MATAPLAYIEGLRNFYGIDFLVNRSTLIPRFETEQLVEKTIALLKKSGRSSPKILDLGTGCGAVAVMLKRMLPGSTVTATDISVQALNVARSNAARQQVELNFCQSDLFEKIDEQFDLIIANLPYVPASRWRFLEDQVRSYEPKCAIVAGRDGLKVIKRLCLEVGNYLNQRGIVALEIDGNHKERVSRLLQLALPHHRCYVQSDLSGRDRFAFAVARQ